MTDDNGEIPSDQPPKLQDAAPSEPPHLPWPEESTSQSHLPPEKPDWKAQLKGHLEKLSQSPWARNLAQRIQHFEPIQAAEWASRTFQRQDAGLYGRALTIGLCTWFLADLTALLIGKYIPEPPLARLSRGMGTGHRMRTLDDYNVIFTRNLFNSQGIIPGEEAPSDLNRDLGGPAVRTTLPLNLVGTLILRDELRSIATIEDKSLTMVYPVRVQDEIPSKARILRIEPRKVTFINTANGRREFLDLPEDLQVGNARIQVGAPAGKGGGIEKISPNQFNVSRAAVDKTLADFNKVLTEARAVPNFENGVPNGYKLFQIVPGSIYDQLGLVNGDVIAGLNGEPINDPGKALSMLQELKTSNHLELQVKKDGKLQTYTYDIR